MTNAGSMFAAIAVTLGLLCATRGYGQDTIRVVVVAHPNDSTYQLEIRGQQFIAYSAAKARQLLRNEEERLALREDLAQRDTLIKLYQARRTLSDSALVHCKAYAFELDSLYRGYRTLADGYRRLARGARVTFDAGLGGSGADRRPAVLLGLGLSRIRVWGFFQERNSGGFVGASLRVF